MNNILNFLIMYFHTYDITTEIVMLILIIALFAIIFFSKPEKTYMMRIFLAGISISFSLIILHVWLLGETLAMRETHSYIKFNILYCIYSVLYVSELNFLFIYQTQLSYKRRAQRLQIGLMCTAFSAVWFTIMLVPMFKGSLLEYSDGIYTLSYYSNAYILCSFICAIIFVFLTIANRKDISRIVLWGSTIFIPIEIVGILTQLYFETAYFICATYTIPFLIYFILFHTNKYNEVFGCQGHEAEHSLLERYIKNKQDFIKVSLVLPRLENRDYSDIEDLLVYFGNSKSRLVEKINHKIRIYSINSYSYNAVCPVKNDEEFEAIKEKLIEIIHTPIIFNGISYNTPMNILISKNYESITTVDEHIALINEKKSLFDDVSVDQIITITNEDAINFKKRMEIQKNLLDIKSSGNYDDDRILVYIQPIYDIKTKTFRTGESLMRMQINGKMIFPDEFIPVAESIDCIHALTKIILYKVAKKTVEMQDKYDFDALTINVSTMEMTDPSAADEFLEIIKSAGADPKKIRLEITESTTISDYAIIISNINSLNNNGVHFYLDDFGTGYSNLERMSSIPFKTIKFDKSLLYRAIEEKRSEELVLLLINFFKSNGFDTVVEGVEDEAQENYVIHAGFDYIQGYYFSKPLPADEAFSFFAIK